MLVFSDPKLIFLPRFSLHSAQSCLWQSLSVKSHYAFKKFESIALQKDWYVFLFWAKLMDTNNFFIISRHSQFVKIEQWATTQKSWINSHSLRTSYLYSTCSSGPVILDQPVTSYMDHIPSQPYFCEVAWLLWSPRQITIFLGGIGKFYLKLFF